jgi:hypothetical protein
MDRRNLLKMIAATTGAAMFSSELFAYEKLSKVGLSDTQFASEDVNLFNEIAEVILPRTNTPGAKDANVGLMSLILANNCYSEESKAAFAKGFASINENCIKLYAKPFLLLSSTQKTQYVENLDQIAKAYNEQNNVKQMQERPDRLKAAPAFPQPHFFTLIKQLTIFSFFTSEIGATRVLKFNPIPGKYDGALDYKKGDRAWAT